MTRMKKILVSALGVLTVVMATELRAVPSIDGSERKLGELRVCDQDYTRWEGELDYKVAQEVKARLESMSSVKWIVDQIQMAGPVRDTIVGPAVFTVGYDSSVSQASVEQLLGIVRSVTHCGELRIAL